MLQSSIGFTSYTGKRPVTTGRDADIRGGDHHDGTKAGEAWGKFKATTGGESLEVEQVASQGIHIDRGARRERSRWAPNLKGVTN